MFTDYVSSKTAFEKGIFVKNGSVKAQFIMLKKPGVSWAFTLIETCIYYYIILKYWTVDCIMNMMYVYLLTTDMDNFMLKNIGKYDSLLFYFNSTNDVLYIWNNKSLCIMIKYGIDIYN